MNYNITNKYNIVDIGTLRLYNDNQAESGISFDTQGVISRSILSAIGVEGQLYYSKTNNYNDGHTECAYLIYKDEQDNEYIIYSNAVYGYQE